MSNTHAPYYQNPVNEESIDNESRLVAVNVIVFRANVSG